MAGGLFYFFSFRINLASIPSPVARRSIVVQLTFCFPFSMLLILFADIPVFSPSCFMLMPFDSLASWMLFPKAIISGVVLEGDFPFWGGIGSPLFLLKSSSNVPVFIVVSFLFSVNFSASPSRRYFYMGLISCLSDTGEGSARILNR